MIAELKGSGLPGCWMRIDRFPKNPRAYPHEIFLSPPLELRGPPCHNRTRGGGIRPPDLFPRARINPFKLWGKMPVIRSRKRARANKGVFCAKYPSPQKKPAGREALAPSGVIPPLLMNGNGGGGLRLSRSAGPHARARGKPSARFFYLTQDPAPERAYSSAKGGCVPPLSPCK